MSRQGQLLRSTPSTAGVGRMPKSPPGNACKPTHPAQRSSFAHANAGGPLQPLVRVHHRWRWCAILPYCCGSSDNITLLDLPGVRPREQFVGSLVTTSSAATPPPHHLASPTTFRWAVLWGRGRRGHIDGRFGVLLTRVPILPVARDTQANIQASVTARRGHWRHLFDPTHVPWT